MDPQPFLRLSVGQLGLKLPGGNASTSKAAATRLCDCEIRLGDFPVQTAQVPLIHSSEFIDPFTNAAVFSLDESDLKAMASPGSFFRRAPRSSSCLEVAVYLARFGARCGVAWRKRLVGVFRVELASSLEWREGKPVMLHHGWAGIGKGEARPELHLRVKMEADPRSGSEEKDMVEMARRERKGWKVAIHNLSGSAVAAAFMATPFVPAPGGDTVARSNPGAWLIVRADTTGSSDSWHPWGRLEARRESSSSSPAPAPASSRDTVRLRLHLLRDGHDDCVLVSETPLSSEKGGEFSIDMDRETSPVMAAAAGHCAASLGVACAGGGFVMSCRVAGEARSSRPLVQLAMRHVTCMEDAAMFVALAAAVDLSVKACRPFPRKPNKKSTSPSPDHLDELDA
nr:unnamed protein product [Digitaria exilis]